MNIFTRMQTTSSKHEQIFLKPLGAGSEVGRSCLHIKYQDKQFLLDCGVHPAYTGVCSLPFLDLVDLSQIDVVFITHFHLDHAAALPFLTEKTNFKGRVYMTHPTKAILKYLLTDFIRVINSNSNTDFYSEKDLKNCYDKITPIDYHQVIDVAGIKLTAYNAGHVLGAAMFRLEINGMALLYTGDFSREDDRHLKKADSMENTKVDILVTESTYGTQCHLSRAERESRFTKVVTDVVMRGGKCLLPVFALGRAQELLLILEEHWAKNPQLQKVPIFYNSALAKRCMGIYQTYLNMMNERMQKIGLSKNPFDFKYIADIGAKELNAIKDNDKPYVIMASPGMLQSGVSRDLFERWCTNSRNGVIIAGYCVDGTLAKEILSNVDTITTQRGQNIKLAMTVEYVSFSAHVDFIQNSEFIYECKPSHLFFVHGEATEMGRLKNAIATKNEKEGIKMELYSLKNGETAGVSIKNNNKALYKVKSNALEFTGLVLKENERIEIHQLDEFLENNDHKIHKIKMTQKQKIPFNATFDVFKHILINDYDATCIDEKKHLYKLNETIFVEKIGDVVVFTWYTNYADDILTMAIIKSLNDLSTTSKSIHLMKNTGNCSHNSTVKVEPETKQSYLLDILKGFFEDVVVEDGCIKINGKNVKIENEKISGENENEVTVAQELKDKIDLLFE